MSEGRIRVYTSAARNYLPKVRLLFESLEQHHPEWERTLLLVEREAIDQDRADACAHRVLALPDLDIPQWEPWSFCHTLVELATAVKPFALRQLLQEDGTSGVLYFDPDMAVYSNLDDIVAAFDGASILLTPHQLAPEVQLGRVVDNEISSLTHGVFNLGFLAVAPGAEGLAFAEWWAQRLYRFCRDDQARGLFTDQKWIDLVPALFEGVGVLRSPRHNVASWNASRRALTLRGSDYFVGDEPLGFYHFTSVSTDSHRLMLLKNSDNDPALSALLEDYEKREQQSTYQGASAGWTLASFRDGSEITDAQRAVYRDSPALQARFPQPYSDQGLAAAIESELSSQDPSSAPLSMGFGAADDALDGDKLRRLLKAAATDFRSARVLARRAMSVLAEEGVSGIRKRLR